MICQVKDCRKHHCRRCGEHITERGGKDEWFKGTCAVCGDELRAVCGDELRAERANELRAERANDGAPSQPIEDAETEVAGEEVPEEVREALATADPSPPLEPPAEEPGEDEVPEVGNEENLPAVADSGPLAAGLFSASTPAEMMQQAADIATPLAKFIEDRRLFVSISGKKHVRVEAWTTLMAMLGFLPRERWCREVSDGQGTIGYECKMDLVRMSDGRVVSSASAECTSNESRWRNRDFFQIRSMAATRATGKLGRNTFSWIMTLAGYEVTPAEEMDGIHDPKPKTTVRAAHEGLAPPEPQPQPAAGKPIVCRSEADYKYLCGVCKKEGKKGDAIGIVVREGSMEVLLDANNKPRISHWACYEQKRAATQQQPPPPGDDDLPFPPEES